MSIHVDRQTTKRNKNIFGLETYHSQNYDTYKPEINKKIHMANRFFRLFFLIFLILFFTNYCNNNVGRLDDLMDKITYMQLSNNFNTFCFNEGSQSFQTKIDNY